MVKSVFVGLGLSDDKYRELGNIGADHLIVSGHNINKKRWKMLQKTGTDLAISVDSFERGGCPLNPKAKLRLKRIIKEVLDWRPKEIWFDHFRFDGHWESAIAKASADNGNNIPDMHESCKWCEGKNRAQEIAKLAVWAKDLIPEKIEVGYFAVPFKKEDVPSLTADLGQDHRLLGKVFDISSPMLYHRMIKKPVSYISEYVKYLHDLPHKQVLPIIQIKDMPDDLPDKLLPGEVKRAYREARKKPSIGVSIFVWEHAVEKNKMRLIKELFAIK